MNGWKRPMFRRLDTPSVEEYQRLHDGTDLERAICELWRGRSIVSSVKAARLSREQADELLVALGEMPADHAQQVRIAEDEDSSQAAIDTLREYVRRSGSSSYVHTEDEDKEAVRAIEYLGTILRP